MARVLLVGPQFTDQDRNVHATVSQWITSETHQVVTVPPSPPERMMHAIRNAIESSDACIAILDGSPVDPSLTWLLGSVHGARRPILGLRSDRRSDIPPEVRASTSELVAVKAWNDAETKAKVSAFLGNIKVFAGALVRDAVPKMLKEQGQDMKFRQVTETEYPRVLKRKLVETSQRLEEADFGVEQEEIADVLELLETLINLRKYDKESLRSIKEGKWRKRGGFQKGYLLEEEPVISSR